MNAPSLRSSVRRALLTMPTNWPRLFAYINALDPTLAVTLVGVDPEVVETVQRDLGLQFPSAYVDFLLAMGVDTGRYSPFGKAMDSDFSRVMRQHPAEGYDIHAHFLVAWDKDLNRTPPYDLYLDLSTSDGEDVSLILAADDGEWHLLDSVRQTFLEGLSSSAWRAFDGARFDQNRLIYVHPSQKSEGLELGQARARALLSEQDFASSLPAMPRVECFTQEATSAIVERREHSGLVTVVVAGNDELALDRIVTSFLDRVPGASVDKRRPSIVVG